MCWNGKDLDSTDHKSHMSYPIQAPDGGDCPAGFPVRIPGIFYEINFDVDPKNWPHGTGTNPFRWSCGDPTGYGLHGDFLNGWDRSVVAAALVDPQCDLSKNPNLNFGNNVKACPPLAPYVQTGSDSCFAPAVPNLVEDLGLSHVIAQLPGCNPITYGPQAATNCAWDTTEPTIGPNNYRGYMRNNATGLYLTVDSMNNTVGLIAGPAQYVSEIFVFSPFSNGSQWHSEGTEGIMGTNPPGNTLYPSKPYVSSWETWFVYPSNFAGLYLIQSFISGGYLTTSGGMISAKGNATDTNALWAFDTPVVLAPGTKLQSVDSSQYEHNSEVNSSPGQNTAPSGQTLTGGSTTGAAGKVMCWLSVFGF